MIYNTYGRTDAAASASATWPLSLSLFFFLVTRVVFTQEVNAVQCSGGEIIAHSGAGGE